MARICALILTCPTCDAQPYQRCWQTDPKSFFGQKILATGNYHPARLAAARRQERDQKLQSQSQPLPDPDYIDITDQWGDY